MTTTTIRVDIETRQALLDLANETGDTLMVTACAAAEALRRQRFAHRVRNELDALRADPDSWADYLATAETTTVSEGIA